MKLYTVLKEASSGDNTTLIGIYDFQGLLEAWPILKTWPNKHLEDMQRDTDFVGIVKEDHQKHYTWNVYSGYLNNKLPADTKEDDVFACYCDDEPQEKYCPSCYEYNTLKMMDR